MGVPTSEVGYTPAMSRKEDHGSPQRHVVALDQKKKSFVLKIMRQISADETEDRYSVSFSMLEKPYNPYHAQHVLPEQRLKQ